MKKYIPYILIFMFCLSCDKNLSFTDSELIWIKPYNKGDELMFKSIGGGEDNLIIKEVKIWNEERDSFSSNYNPVYAEVISEEGSLIKIFKSYPDETKAFFRFKNDFLVVKDLNRLKFKKNRFKGEELNCYKFKIDAEEHNIREFVWSEKYGIIEYIDNNSNKWLLNKFIRNEENILKKGL